MLEVSGVNRHYVRWLETIIASNWIFHAWKHLETSVHVQEASELSRTEYQMISEIRL